MIGTIEALGVFLLAILPGFLGLRVYGYGRPPLRLRGALGELGATVVASAAGWTVLYLWRGEDLLPIVLGEPERSTEDRLDAFAELAVLSILIGLALGLVVRIGSSIFRATLLRRLQLDALQPVPGTKRRIRDLPQRVRDGLSREIRSRSLPASAWDRLLTRLANRGEAVICRVKTRSGAEVLGVLARDGYLDWEADGRGLLFDLEVTRDAEGTLRPLPDSRGVYVPGEEIAVLSVVKAPDAALPSTDDG